MPDIQSAFNKHLLNKLIQDSFYTFLQWEVTSAFPPVRGLMGCGHTIYLLRCIPAHKVTSFYSEKNPLLSFNKIGFTEVQFFNSHLYTQTIAGWNQNWSNQEFGTEPARCQFILDLCLNGMYIWGKTNNNNSSNKSQN